MPRCCTEASDLGTPLVGVGVEGGEKGDGGVLEEGVEEKGEEVISSIQNARDDS